MDNAATNEPTSFEHSEELQRLHKYWLACNYLAAGMIYLRDNPLLRQPLETAHIKRRLLGHWGSSPGQSFVLSHLNRAIRKFDLNVLYVSGPGHGAPAILANAYLDGYYSELYPQCPPDEAGMLELFRRFSFPGGIGSHCTPETPGSIHEGGELGYSLSHGFGAAFDNPGLLVAVVVGDGEAETGPLATSWHGNKFLNPARDGAVLPILHLNGYKIANPTILARIPEDELRSLLVGYGWEPLFVAGDDPAAMHVRMAAALDQCIERIMQIQGLARQDDATPERPRWPMIVLRSPKGWTGPRRVDGHQVEGTWRAHQVPVTDPDTHPERLRLVEQWMRSYKPEELFDELGRPTAEIRACVPEGNRRISANPHANGGTLCIALDMPDYREYAVHCDAPGAMYVSPTHVLGLMLRDIIRRNPRNFRLFGPDETASNKLDDVYEATGKAWMEEVIPVDADGGYLSVDGRVMEMLSEHTLEGWLEGYLLTGRHGLLASYEAFIHVIDSMFNQHAKWLEKAKHEVRWRASIPSLNILITSLVWRQDHNGFTHQDPGFLDLVTNKSPEVVRIYLPPDANCLLSVADHCLRSRDYVNVIVADKQPHLVYLDKEAAAHHCAVGIGRWDWASTDTKDECDVVMACAGDIPTMETLAAISLLRSRVPGLRMRMVNVVDLFRLMHGSMHPHGMSDEDFDALFTIDKPVIFNFHAYPALIHKLCYRRHNSDNFHVHGYREQGNINSPLELAIKNEVDRFSLAIAALRWSAKRSDSTEQIMTELAAERDACLREAYKEGIDSEAIRNWTWAQ
jgi:xylulose-5-phosphate/fructose-6-phosphate phosphoketolase